MGGGVMEQLTEYVSIRIPKYIAKDLMAFLDEQGVTQTFQNEVDELRYMVMMDKIISKGIDSVKDGRIL